MAMAKNGRREITVAGSKFYYKISNTKTVSDWSEDINELNRQYIEYVERFGQRGFADATLKITIQATTDAHSNLLITVHTLLINTLIGVEQVIDITPKHIAQFIKQAKDQGWQPHHKGDYKLNFAQQLAEDKQPVMLQLPTMEDVSDNYENVDKPKNI